MSRSYIKAPRTRNLGKIQYDVQFEGDWDKVIRTLEGTSTTIRLGMIAGQESAARKLIKIVKHHIRTNGGELGWQPLKPSTIKKKNRLGYTGDSIYQMTGTYYRNIKQWRKGDKIYVGLQKGIMHPVNKSATLGQIANMLEYGSAARGIPPRPLWIPSFRDSGGTKTIRRLILWHIGQSFRIRHGISPKMTI